MFAPRDTVTFFFCFWSYLRSSAADHVLVLIRLYPCSSVANGSELAEDLLGRPFIPSVNLNYLAIGPD